MRPVIIEMRKGQPTIIQCPKKVQVIFREPKKKSFQKKIRTYLYQLKVFLGVV